MEEADKPIDFVAFCYLWIKDTPKKGKDNYKTALNSFTLYW